MTTPDTLLFSVIIPLVDGRTNEVECIRSWTHHQQFPRDRYQVVVVSAGDNQELDRQAASLLQPHDIWVPATGALHSLYHAAATRAEADVLLFTELHCRADPNCLTALEDWLKQHDEAGVSVSSRHQSESLVGDMEQMVFEEQFVDWSTPGNWRNLMDRGFALRRAIYQDAGGFRGEFLYFADVAFAARLHRLGHRIGISADAWVTHINSPDFALLHKNAKSYAQGEHRFRIRPDSVAWEDYIGLPEEWTDALADREGSAWRSAWALLRSVLWTAWANYLPIARRRRTLGRLFLSNLASAVFGPRWRRGKLFLQLSLAQLQYHFPRLLRSDQLTAFKTIWNLFIQQELVRLALAEPRSREGSGLSLGTNSADTISSFSWFGVYGLEKANGLAFRWTKPVSRLRWTLPANQRYEILLETGGLRSPSRVNLLGAFWNGQRLAESDILEEGTRLRLRVRGSSTRTENELLLVSLPFTPSWHGGTDSRCLGLPVFSVECEAVTLTRTAREPVVEASPVVRKKAG